MHYGLFALGDVLGGGSESPQFLLARRATFLYPRGMCLRISGIWAKGLTLAVAMNCASAWAQTAGSTSAFSSGDGGDGAEGRCLTGSVSAKSSGAVDRYAAEPTVIERNDREVSVAADGSGSEQQTIVIRVQTEAAVKELGVVSFTFASASQHVDIDYVRVRHPDGSIVDTPVSDALEMPTEIMRQAPFYSDLKQKQIPVRGLRPGDRLEWSVRLVRSKAEAPGRFWGISAFTGKERVALAESFTLRLPGSIPSTVWSPKLAAKMTEEGRERVYRWTSSQLEPTAGPDAEARNEAEKKLVLSSDEVTDRTEGELPLIAWTNFPDWSSVGAWYRELAKDRIAPDAAIKAKASELTAGKVSDEEEDSCHLWLRFRRNPLHRCRAWTGSLPTSPRL